MTKSEFLERQNAAKREEKVVSIIWLIVFFGLLIGNLPLANWLDRQKFPTWIQVTYGVLFFGFLIGNLVLLIWTLKRRARKFGLICPSCNKPLTAFTGQLAITTGKCGHCGQQVFEDE